MAGISKDRPELAAAPMPLEARISPPACARRRGSGAPAVRAAGGTSGSSPFLGLDGEASPQLPRPDPVGHRPAERALEPHLRAGCRCSTTTSTTGSARTRSPKLLARGEGWLGDHPGAGADRPAAIWAHRGSLARQALARLVPEEAASEETGPERAASREEALESPIRLHDQRLATVAAALQANGARVVADLGCGEGKLIALAGAGTLGRAPDRRRRLDPRPRTGASAASSLTSPAASPRGADHAAARRPDLSRPALGRGRRRRPGRGDRASRPRPVAGADSGSCSARPGRGLVVVTTPNADYNALFSTLGAGSFRHA